MYATISFILNVVLAAGLILAARKILRDREDRKLKGLFRSWPIRRVTPDAFDPRFITGPFGPAHATEIRFIANFRVEGGISDMESWILCNLAKTAACIFEIGTCTGKTTYLLAANAPANAQVTTLTLAPNDLDAYRMTANDHPDSKISVAAESRFTEFYYEGTPEKARIKQLMGDSKAFDDLPYAGSCDLIFVDGSHAYSYVKSDSSKALRMVKPGGIILWHDYYGPRRAPGVFKALNELAREISLVHIAGTSFIAYRRPH